MKRTGEIVMSELDRIKIVFRDLTESLWINVRHIEGFVIRDIHKEIKKTEINCVAEVDTADHIEMELLSAADKALKGGLFDRLEKKSDVSSIQLIFRDDKKETIFVQWSEEDNTCNEWQDVRRTKRGSIDVLRLSVVKGVQGIKPWMRRIPTEELIDRAEWIATELENAMPENTKYMLKAMESDGMMYNSEARDMIRSAGSVDKADAVISQAWPRTIAEKEIYVKQLFPELEKVQCSRSRSGYNALVAMAVN